MARHARNAGIRVIGIGGSLADERELAQLFDGVEATITEPCSLEEALSEAGPRLTAAAGRAMRLLLAGRPIPGR